MGKKQHCCDYNAISKLLNCNQNVKKKECLEFQYLEKKEQRYEGNKAGK